MNYKTTKFRDRETARMEWETKSRARARPPARTRAMQIIWTVCGQVCVCVCVVFILLFSRAEAPVCINSGMIYSKIYNAIRISCESNLIRIWMMSNVAEHNEFNPCTWLKACNKHILQPFRFRKFIHFAHRFPCIHMHSPSIHPSLSDVYMLKMWNDVRAFEHHFTGNACNFWKLAFN